MPMVHGPLAIGKVKKYQVEMPIVHGLLSMGKVTNH